MTPTLRIVDQVFNTNYQEVADWLNKILSSGGGYAKLDKDNVLLFRNNDINFKGGIMLTTDPITKGVMIASSIVGVNFFSSVFPDLLSEIDKRWTQEVKTLKKR